ncbi:succinylglutamate desuccinylase/aspartoacylase family protein [Paraburkholderia sp. BCC1885]|uniref:succinylglutamate desuccinylase/aspartoacylase family protein n=1 Tax=Paraburkholderia sp. BCC1885 TaxID=2562669 RepID=UPI0011829556|nr:succinylglutamate desuccinylase/aspartoacylase family protein [Paraburkholderia sp. BCC1885]
MHSVKHRLLASSDGTAHQLISHHFGGEGHGKKIYIQAGLHADEIPGMLVALTVADKLQQLEQQGRLRCEVVLVNSANPIGLSQYVLGYAIGRFELASGRNFNRGFALLAPQIAEAVEGKLGANADANRAIIHEAWRDLLLAQPPRQAFDDLQRTLMLLSLDADIILDLHCSREAAVHLYTGEAIWPEVEPLARYLGARASLLAFDSGAQSFDEAHSLTWWQLRQHFGERFPIPHGSAAVTVEHRGQRDVSDELAQQDATAIIDYLTYCGAIDAPVTPLPPLTCAATPLGGSEQFYAPCAGILLHGVNPGAHVTVGQQMFVIVDTTDGTRTAIHSRTEGFFYMRRDVRYVRQGDPLGRVSGHEVIRSGNLLSA